jgi:lysophospholipase L1-like esterase
MESLPNGFRRMSEKKTRARWRAWVTWLCLVFLLLTSAAAACEVAYRVFKGRWYWQDRRASSRRMVQPHPYLGAALIPSVSDTRGGVKISHNSLGLRNEECKLAKTPGRLRVVTLGGSSTYCVGISDDQTWPRKLQELLGADYEVINLAGPGYGSVEHLIQTALLFSEFKPDIAIYYAGWNDAHVQHVKDLKADFSDYHGQLVMSLGLAGRQPEEKLAATYFLKRILFHRFFSRMEDAAHYARGTEDQFTDRVDTRAIELWERNLKLTAELCKKQGVRAVFAPQILNYNQLVSDRPYGWFPFVRDCDVKKIMAAYHASMEKVAKAEGVDYIQELLTEPFAEGDFIDNGHFSAQGCQRFARVVAARIGSRKTN